MLLFPFHYFFVFHELWKLFHIQIHLQTPSPTPPPAQKTRSNSQKVANETAPLTTAKTDSFS